MSSQVFSSLFKSSRNLPSMLGPVWIAFVGSLLLSAIAIHGMEGPNRDGMLYIETAELFANNGLAAARANFDWVFFPICIAVVSKLTGLGCEAASYVLSVLLFACVCATLVRITAHHRSDAAWSACLVALSLPAFNNYRDFVIREFGFWLFCLLAILVAMRWARKPGWLSGIAVQALIAVASLFRVEAIVFLAALTVWQLTATYPWRQRLLNLSMLIGFSVCGSLILFGLIAASGIDLGGRVTTFAAAANPILLFSQFSLAAGQFSRSVLNHYSEHEAASILFFGLLSTIPKKFLLSNGAFLIPLLNALRMNSLRQRVSDWQPMGWFFLAYVFVLTSFVTYNLFLSGRYVSFLNVLAVPLIAVGLKDLLDRFPRWRHVLVGIALLTALANVVSRAPNETLYREAGRWLAENSQLASKMYIGSPRAGYYGGPAYRIIRNRGLPPEGVGLAVRNKQFEYFVLEMDPRDTKEVNWVRSLNLNEVARFIGRKGDVIVILKREGV